MQILGAYVDADTWARSYSSRSAHHGWAQQESRSEREKTIRLFQ
jgi:hypothetical protein